MALLSRSSWLRRFLVVVVALASILAVTGFQREAQAVCNNNFVADPWYRTDYSDCGGIFGSPGWRQGYVWGTAYGTNQTACVQVLGFNSYGTRTWISTGCGQYARVSVNWGNVIATPGIRAKSVLSSYYAFINWQTCC